MARKNPVGKLAETALSALKDPKAAAEKAVEQAKGTVALGKMAAGTGVSMVGSVAGSVVGKARGRGGRQETYAPRSQAPVKVAEKKPTTGPTAAPTGPTTGPTAAPTSSPDLRAVPDVNEPADTPPGGAKVADSPKKHGDVLEAPTARTAAQAKKAPAAKKAAAKKSSAKKAAPRKTAATPADVAGVVEAAVAEDPKKTAAQPAKKAATKSTAKKASAKKTPARKSSPGGKLPARKAQPKQTKEQPKTAAELAANEGDDVRTPSGIPAVSEGKNPSTDDTTLTQPSTEPLVDPATAKQVAAESDTLRKAAENNPE